MKIDRISGAVLAKEKLTGTKERGGLGFIKKEAAKLKGTY